jgi:hypothetical protein
VIIIVAKEVAIAVCMLVSTGIPWRGNSQAKNGTIAIPPPIPKRPEISPVKDPNSKQYMKISNTIKPWVEKKLKIITYIRLW